MKLKYSLLGVGSVALASALVWSCNSDDSGSATGGTAGTPATGAAGTAAIQGPGEGTAGTGAIGAAGAANVGAAGTGNTGAAGAAAADDGVNDTNVPTIDGGILNNPDVCPATQPTDGSACEIPDGEMFLACAYDTQNCLCGAPQFGGGGPGGGMLPGATDGGVPVWNCFGGGMFGGLFNG